MKLCRKLREELDRDQGGKSLEKLAKDLIADLLGQRLYVAKSGFQDGGDAGSADGALRIECKRYKSTAAISSREIVGTVEQALLSNQHLDCWILVTTTRVHEQLARVLESLSEKEGFPIPIFDWGSEHMPRLSVLCASNPNIVASSFSPEAGGLARQLANRFVDQIAQLRKELHDSYIGYQALRALTHRKLEKIWNDRAESFHALAQNAALGSFHKVLDRQRVAKQLTEWKENDEAVSPCVVLGKEGVGKTWATLQWIKKSADELPLVFVTGASSFSNVSRDEELLRILASYIRAEAGNRTLEYWSKRLENLLSHNQTIGPCIYLLVDGLNQNPGAKWLRILHICQAGKMGRGLRCLFTSRRSFFGEDLGAFVATAHPPEVVEIPELSSEPGGEFDQLLEMHGLKREELSSGLLPLALNLRLFTVIVRMMGRFCGIAPVTKELVLWEYGHDIASSGGPFSQTDWCDLLVKIAENWRQGKTDFSPQELIANLERADRTPCEVRMQTSQLIDSHLTDKSGLKRLRLVPALVNQALALLLLHKLDSSEDENQQNVVHMFFEPIDGLDERTEILWAAITILLEQTELPRPLLNILVAALFRSQNFSDEVETNLRNRVPDLVEAALSALENSVSLPFARARLVEVLSSLDNRDTDSLGILSTQFEKWFSVVSLDRSSSIASNSSDIEERRSEGFQRRIGRDHIGEMRILGRDFQILETDEFASLRSCALEILRGRPLSGFAGLFEAAAIALAAAGRNGIIDVLEWMCIFNEEDPQELGNTLAATSDNLLNREQEDGLHPDFKYRVAAVLLYMSHIPELETRALKIDRRFEDEFTYESYLKDPANPFFHALERRHAHQVSSQQELPLLSRVGRLALLIRDPSFSFPDEFTKEVREFASCVDVAKLDRFMSSTTNDHEFEVMHDAVARLCPNELVRLTRLRFKELVDRNRGEICWPILRDCLGMLAVEKDDATNFAQCRTKIPGRSDGNEVSASCRLVLLEIIDLSALEQLRRVMAASRKEILNDSSVVLKTPTAEEVDLLLHPFIACAEGNHFERTMRLRDRAKGTSGSRRRRTHFRSRTTRRTFHRSRTPSSRRRLPRVQHRVKSQEAISKLLVLLSMSVSELSDRAAAWVAAQLRNRDKKIRGLAAKTLYRAEPRRLCHELARSNWKWRASDDTLFSYFASRCLAEYGEELASVDVLTSIAPWDILRFISEHEFEGDCVKDACVLLDEIVANEDTFTPPSQLKATVFVGSEATDPQVEFQPNTESLFQSGVVRDEEIKKNHATFREKVQDYVKRIQTTNYLQWKHFSPRYFDRVVADHFSFIEKWLQPMRTDPRRFSEMVFRSECFFVSLCECLLNSLPEVGAELWGSLNEVLHSRFQDRFGNDEMIGMLFRADRCPTVDSLRSSLFAIESCNSDERLMQLAVIASLNGATEWLNNFIEADLDSNVIWRQMRGEVLNGWTCGNELPIDEAWFEGMATPRENLRWRSAQLRFREACARHWWHDYLHAQTKSETVRAFSMFLTCADSRSWKIIENSNLFRSDDRLQNRKWVHVMLQEFHIKQKIKDNQRRIESTFLGERKTDGVFPWLTGTNYFYEDVV